MKWLGFWEILFCSARCFQLEPEAGEEATILKRFCLSKLSLFISWAKFNDNKIFHQLFQNFFWNLKFKTGFKLIEKYI